MAGGPRETYEFRVDDEVFHVKIEGDEAEIRQGPAADPDLIVGGDAATFLSVAAGRLAPVEALDTSAIWVGGNPEAVARCLTMLGSSHADHPQEAVHEDSGAVDTL
jgi:putative sterol carrier protein